VRLENKSKVESDELTSLRSCSVVMARMFVIGVETDEYHMQMIAP
jgi:hypothetical protein